MERMKKLTATTETEKLDVTVTEDVFAGKEEAATKASKAESQKKSVHKANAGILVYCGPTIKGIATQYAHFNNGLPKKLNEYSQENKDVKRLIVPVEKFIDTKRNIHTKGTIENLSFIRIQEGD
ncbi:hypothetical protein QA584_17305 [Anaerocolumna sp. AGMB13025]|uniref:hypothetical protein n=1 Tax=Anaerocolumna sp. AGMB13025 TaxID=3039116 RepID=UPI00241D3B3F|nr:hypothetical protein [Anaerocolumna sp. AGMB13025]WFR55358.1 hypothetical protein QA584_17305 [Anaerocolumna sp. AGMB13025]